MASALFYVWKSLINVNWGQIYLIQDNAVT